MVRGALRTLLGRHLDAPPESLVFEYGRAGKPALVHPAAIPFNVSHSGAIALIALSPEVEVGVDVEAIRPVPEMEKIAERFFCRAEAEDLRRLPKVERNRAFFLCWTRKEAYIKATGDGLSMPLDSFRVVLDPGMTPDFLHLPEAAGLWTLQDLVPAPNYAAALAYPGPPRTVITYDFL